MIRKGQIFLIMTILTITFLIGISTVLFNIKKAEYIDPSSDSDEVFEVWKNSVEAIEDIIKIEIAVNTQAGAASGNYDADLNAQFGLLEDYLLSRGFGASITLVGNTVYTAPLIGGQSVAARFDATVKLYLSSISGIVIDQELNFAIIYSAVVDINNVLTVKQIVNGKVTYLAGCSFTSAGTQTDNGNGSYDLVAAPGTPYVISTQDKIELEVDSV